DRAREREHERRLLLQHAGRGEHEERADPLPAGKRRVADRAVQRLGLLARGRQRLGERALDDRPVLRDEPLERRGGARLRRPPRHVAAPFPPSVSGWPSHCGGGSSPTSLTIVGATSMTRGLSSAIGRLQKKIPGTSDGSIEQWSPLQTESLSNTTCSA